MAKTSNILSFPHGEPLDERFPEFEPVEEGVFDTDLDDIIALVDHEQMKNMLDRLDSLRLLVTQGRVGALLFVGQDPVTGYFLTETCLDPATNRTELFGFVGVLENLKLEISEQASMAPVINLAGSVVDPYSEAEA